MVPPVLLLLVRSKGRIDGDLVVDSPGGIVDSSGEVLLERLPRHLSN
jgi:hypothetical protein